MLIENPLNESPLAFPVLEYIHFVGLACGVGTIALLDFRLLGLGLTRKPAAQLWSETLLWTLGGLLLVIFSGLMLFSINPDVYYLNYVFLSKMSLLSLAILFHYTIVRKAAKSAAASGATSAMSRTVACISLALWTCVIFGGIFIGLSATRPPAAAPPPDTNINFEDFLKATPPSPRQ
jgi:hypothetical protein